MIRIVWVFDIQISQKQFEAGFRTRRAFQSLSVLAHGQSRASAPAQINSETPTPLFDPTPALAPTPPLALASKPLVLVESKYF